MNHALLQAWEETVRRRPGDRAVVQASDRRSWTFGELDRRSGLWTSAHAPRERELAGRRVVFAVPNGMGWFEIFLGLMRAGAVAVPLDASEPPAAQRSLAIALRAARWWDGGRLVPLPRSLRCRDPSICLVKLTSGTTGRPRPLAFSAAQLLADAAQVTGTMGIRPRDLNYALVPLGHSYGLGSLALPLVAQGVPLVCGQSPLPHAIARDLGDWSPTAFPGVPAIWRALVASDVEPAALRGLRLAISAGAPLPPEVAAAYAARFGRRLLNFYGSSETGGIAFDRSGRATLSGGVGRALRGVEIVALPGGRIRVCSAAVFTRGNRRGRGPLGCWVPPDRVAFDARGGLRLAGRCGAMAKIAGRRVDLAEVAARLRRLPGVRDAWVSVRPGVDPVLGAALATDRPIGELRAALHADTAAWKTPRKWSTWASLPLTARGKIDTRLLSARLWDQRRLDLHQQLGAADVRP